MSTFVVLVVILSLISITLIVRLTQASRGTIALVIVLAAIALFAFLSFDKASRYDAEQIAKECIAAKLNVQIIDVTVVGQVCHVSSLYMCRTWQIEYATIQGGHGSVLSDKRDCTFK